MNKRGSTHQDNGKHRVFNRTKVARKNCPKKKVLKTNKGLLRMRVKSKNENPEYRRRGTRAKGKIYRTPNQPRQKPVPVFDAKLFWESGYEAHDRVDFLAGITP